MKTLINEAARKLDAYLKSGTQGFFQQAKDRLTACGINCGGYEAKDAEHLRDFLRIYWGA